MILASWKTNQFPENTFAISIIGKKRISNQDFFLINQSKHIYIICDGLGGEGGAGDYASEQASMLIENSLTEDLLKSFQRDENKIKKQLHKILEESNQHIISLSQDDPIFHRMASTIVLAVIVNKNLHIINLGDSRAYALSSESVRLLSHDHRRKSDNKLTQVLGIQKEINPYYTRHQFKKNEMLLLCTDGFSDFVSTTEIQSILMTHSSSTCRECCENLFRKAIENGSTDDITLILLQN